MENQFTEKELMMLSEGQLAMIENINHALELVRDEACVTALQALREQYTCLNSKICNMLPF